jgi:hypothetical protein
MVPDHAFIGCRNLASVVLPDGITSIQPSAFAGCTNLANIALPKTLKSIGGEAFAECISLTRVTIPEGVISIGNWAFDYCSSLESVVIHGSVTNFEIGAFGDCANLQAVYFTGEPPPSDPIQLFYSSFPIVYYLPDTERPWPASLSIQPTRLWDPHAVIDDTNFGMKSGQFNFKITATPGLSFMPDLVVVVEAATDLKNPVWIPISTNTLTGGSSAFVDPDSANHPSRFYRFRSP